MEEKEIRKIWKKTTLGISALLLLMMLRIATATGTRLYVWPQTKTITVNLSFDIEIRVEDVTDLYGYQFKLSFDKDKLMCVDNDIHIPTEWTNWWCQENEIDNDAGTYWVAVSALKPSQPFSTEGYFSLVTLEFKALEVVEESVLHLYGTELVDYGTNIMTHTTTDGSVKILTPSVGDDGISEPVSGDELRRANIELAISVILLITIPVGSVVFVICRKRKRER